MHTYRNTNRPAAMAIALFVIVAAIAVLPVAAQRTPAAHAVRAVDISRDPADVPPPVGNRPPTTVKVDLVAREVVGELDPASHTTYRYWTFNGKVPGPMIRVRVADQVEVTLYNDRGSQMVHSIDLHAVLGPGGGAATMQVLPGEQKTFTFTATTPGLFVYHCGTPMIADHIANGMFGLILVEPAGGLPHVDHEYYVMQSEIYTTAPIGKAGMQMFSEAKLMEEDPEYFVLNGAVGALTKDYPLAAKTGDTVRIFFGNAGPNKPSAMHMVGEIFTHDYQLGSLTSPPLDGVQTANVPPGDAAMLELKAVTAGQFNFMDHAIARMAKGMVGTLNVTGVENAGLIHAGPAANAAGAIAGITPQDEPGALPDTEVAQASGPAAAGDNAMAEMDMSAPAATPSTHVVSAANNSRALTGCLHLQSDGRVLLSALGSNKLYRLEGQPLSFDANGGHIVHVSGKFGSVMAAEDPHVPSFVVDNLAAVAADCSAKITAADIERVVARASGQATGGTTVRMVGMTFDQRVVVVNVGQEVVWKNTSGVIHNVVADPARALVAADVHVPAGAHAFASQFLQPGQTYAHKFTVPGVYKYVCTLHESNGMKGIVIVKNPAATEMASSTRH